jgi:hypothetical protein
VRSIQARLRAWVVPELPVPMILGVIFLYRYVRAILPRERKVYLEDPRTKSSSEVCLKRRLS